MDSSPELSLAHPPRLTSYHAHSLIASIAFLAGLLLIFTGSAGASDRFYSDYTTRSPDGRYEFTARSPDNRWGRNPPFQSHFVYRLRDRKSGKVYWTIRQDDAERADPSFRQLTSIYIHPSGWSVASDDGNTYHCFRPDGVQTGKVDILGSFPRSDVKKYVQDSSVGPIWEAFVDNRFLEYGGRLYFGIRPWWGRYILIDVALGKCVPIPPALSAQWRAAIGHDAIEMLRRGAARQAELEKDCCSEIASETMKGAFLVGALRIGEALPLLRQLEPSKSSEKSCCASTGEAPTPPGQIAIRENMTYTLRELVHLSLRRLGEKPAYFPIVLPKIEAVAGGDGGHPPCPAPPFPRAQRAAGIRTGLSPDEVVKLLSGPDFVGDDSANHSTWEYDIDSDRPYTLVLHWKGRRVGSIERLRPARWQQENVREKQITSS